MNRSVLCVALLAVFASTTIALSPEEAGRTSWLRQQLGAVTDARIAGSRVYAVTRQGVLAALNLADGKIAWRKRLDPGVGLTLAGDKVLALETSRVFAFQASDGAALWELPTHGPAAVAAVDGAILVASGGNVQVVAPGSGAPLHVMHVASKDEGLEHSVLSMPDQPPLLLTWSPTERTLLVDAVDVAAGALTRKARHSVPGGGFRVGEAAVLGGERLVVPAADGGTLCHAELAGSAELDCGTQRSASGETLLGFSLPAGSPRTGEALGYATTHGAALMAFRRGALGAIAIVPGAVSVPGAGDDGTQAAFLVPVTGTPQTLELVKLSVEHAGAGPGPAPSLVGPVPGAPARAFSGPGGSILTVWDDGELALFDSVSVGSDVSSPPRWSSPEALADSVASLFVPLPPPSAELERSLRAARPGAGAALRAQWLALKAQLGALSAVEAAELAEHRRVTDTRLLPVRDADGFRAQVLVLTAPGRLFSLHTGDGRVLWSVDLGARSALEFKTLQSWRVPHRLQDAEQVLVIAEGRGANDPGAAFVINAYEGTVVRRMALPSGPLTWIKLPEPLDDAGNAAQVVFLCFAAASDGAVETTVLPDTAAARAAAVAASAKLTLWRPAVGSPTTTLQGLRVTARSDGGLDLTPAWSARLAGPGQRILLTKAVDSSAAAATGFAKTVGGDQVVFRYLNPSFILVIAGPERSESGDDSQSAVSVYLLDGVTGRLLWSQVHEDARGPVAGVVSENWAAYQFWSLKAGRWQVGSVELYDGTPREFSVADLAFVGPANLTRDAWDPTPLQALSRSFFAKYAAATMTVTATKHGITAPQVLLGLDNGQVYMLDRRFLDPRRPVTAKPTPAQQAEGLIPYASDLPVAGAGFETHGVRVWGLRELQSRPTEMESTALLLARGLDLFGGRLVPRGTYDQVPEGYPFGLLVLMGIAMAFGVMILQRLAASKAAARMWA